MVPETYISIVFFLALGGVCFAGYLSAHRIVMRECAFNEPCPYFLNFPACFFGFFLFLIMFCSAGLAFAENISFALATRVLLWVSLAGILFAGYFTMQELVDWIRSGMKRYTLILPTCAYGLVFYIAIFILSLAQ